MKRQPARSGTQGGKSTGDSQSPNVLKYLNEMTAQMNTLHLEQQQQQRQQQHQQQQSSHPLERRLPESSSTAVAPSSKTTLNLGGGRRVAGSVRHRIMSGRIDEGDEDEEAGPSEGQVRESHLDVMMQEAQAREGTRKYLAKANENDELSFVVRNLQIRLQEVEEECMRYSIAMQAEVKEKRKLELRNADLSSKLADARQGLRDTQAALQSVQQATEQLVLKRDQRDSQMQRVVAENKVYEARIFELENTARNAESAVKSLTHNRDELMEKLQGQLGEAQDAFFKSQAEAVRLRGEKTMLEAELDSTKRKLTSTDLKARQAETGLHATYKAEIDRLEDRLRIFSDKIDEGRSQEQRSNELQAEIRNKANDLKTLESKLLACDAARKEQEMRTHNVEAQLRTVEVAHRQLDMRHRNLEQEFARATSEIHSLKRFKNQSEEDMREVAMQNAQLASDKQDLRTALASLEAKFEAHAELAEMAKRQKRELERVNNQLDEAGRRIIDLERTHRILTDDTANTEARVKSLTARMSSLLARDSELRNIILVANARITDLYNLARDMYTKFLAEELRADRLEKDFTGMVSKRLYSSVDVPYAAPPVVPLPMPMDAGGGSTQQALLQTGLYFASAGAATTADSSYQQQHQQQQYQQQQQPPSFSSSTTSLSSPTPSSYGHSPRGAPASREPHTPNTDASPIGGVARGFVGSLVPAAMAALSPAPPSYPRSSGSQDRKHRSEVDSRGSHASSLTSAESGSSPFITNYDDE